MLNFIWLILLAGGIIYAMLNGTIDAITSAAFKASGDAITIAIDICGMLCLWLGILKLAEKAGLINGVAKLISPIIRLLFPDLAKDSPAFGAIIMNIAANLLGLGNAATPFGLKAMEHLQAVNPNPQVASPAMITFLVLNTSGITLIPTLVISLRAQAGSLNPSEIIVPAIIATTIGTIFAIIFDRLLRHLYFRSKL